MLHAVLAALALGLVMTAGDFLWSALNLRHRVAYGLIHGAVMCLCLAVTIGVRAGKPGRAALAGPLIGVIAAASFYALVPVLRWGALFPAWMVFWILFAFLQQRLDRNERLAAAALRGVMAALLSGVAFYLISGIWTNEARYRSMAIHFAAWSIAFLPGFLVLFYRVGAKGAKGAARC
jgi:uncharacterized membrane protein